MPDELALLVGARDDGPADAAVLAPKLGSTRGIVIGSGLNPRYSHIDPAAMAECALDEALRNVVAVGGDPVTDPAAIIRIERVWRAGRSVG